jgi:hypothetical protein
MANVYVEPRPKGRPEGSRIDDYVVEDHADHVLGTFGTQREAIDWAKSKGHAPLVARVRHLALVARSTPVPAICQLLLCLAVDPEFQEDRLGDFQERFDNTWVPKFGPRGAVAIYVWHVLR